MAYEVDGGAVMQVTFEGDLMGQQVMTTFSYIFESEAPVDGVQAISIMQTDVNTAVTGLYAKYRAAICSAVNNLRQVYQWVTPVRYAAVTLIPTVRTGSIVTEPLPANVCAVITRQGDLAKRTDISNLHIPGLPIAAVADGYIDGAHAAKLQELIEIALAEAVVGFGTLMKPVAFHRSAPALSSVLRTGYVQDTSRVLRRRTVRVGS